MLESIEAQLLRAKSLIMTKKRKRSDHPSSVESISDSAQADSSQPRLDPSYGQRAAFPGLDTVRSSDAISYDEDGEADALEYLRMVR